MAMKIIGKAVGWLFSPPPSPISWAKVILWWEIRRIPYNIFAGLYGILCFFIFLWAMTTSGPSDDGEDFFEPFALFLAPFVVNFCYTLGWLVGVAARTLLPSLSPRFGPGLMKVGIGFSVLMISIPAVISVGFRLVQLARGAQ